VGKAMFYFIRWKHTEEGYAPDIPAGTGFVMLAEPGPAYKGGGFALFRGCLPDACGESEGVKPVSDELADLLQSAEDYPPALALTREDLKDDESQSEIEFSEKLVERLTFHLQRQIHSPFFMAKAKDSQIGYRHAGAYYWIVGCKDKSVLWISRDYHVYHDPLGDFELDANEVELRFSEGQ
jgi:hypothetical protein